MALFLQESQTQVETTGGLRSLSEAFEALMDIAVEHGNLTEAMLTADYQIEMQAKALTEAGDEEGAAAKVKKFGAKAGTAVKNFAVRVFNRIADIARLCVRKLGEYVAKLRGVVSGTTCSGPKNLSDYVNACVRNAERLITAVASASATGSGKPGKEGDIPALASEHADMPVTVVNNLVSSVNGAVNKLEGMAKKYAGEAGKIDGEGGDAAKAAQLRAGAAYAREAAANLTKATSVLGSVAASAKAKKAAPAAAEGEKK